ncbi:MAG: NHLP family bacteriocin export ABC transporter peptidase/permease/ATPase subunit [Selenomonadaceae bacterium]|nr:NHLP family bacteriocin export ABC transporter peptidase/permease/ATPase subunit [Selenomonadaceae bacterium]
MKVLDSIKNFFDTGSRVKVPTILQMEAVECGAASLAMVLAYYGKWIPLEKLHQECGVTRDGSNAENILKAAENLGCVAKGFAGRPVALRKKAKNNFPLILFWEFNHFVVLEGIKGDIVYLNDPAMGRRKLLWKDFLPSYTGVYLQIRPGKNFRKEGHRYNIFKTLAEKLVEDKWAVLFVLILGLCMIIPGLAVPVFNQIFLDDILTLKRADWIKTLLVTMVGTVIFTGFLNWLRASILTVWQKKLTLVDSSKFFWHIIRLPLTFFQQRYAADVAARIQYNETNAEVLSNQAATAVLDFFIALFYLALLFQYSVSLTLIGVSISFINLALVIYMRRRLVDLNMKVQQDAGREYGVLMSGLMMIESIKGCGNDGEFFSKWAGYKAKVINGMQEIQLWTLKVKLLPSLFAGVNGALIMAIGGFSIMEGVMTAGIYMAFQNLLGRFQEPFNKLLMLGGTLQTIEMQMQRLDDVRKYEIDRLNYSEDNQPKNCSRERLSGELELKNISFGYSPLDPPLLENFNLHIEPGRWAAVVGASGSGKSTLAKIVAGLYEEWSGEILFDGIKRRDIPRHIIVNSLSTVDQDVFLLTGSVQENISLFDGTIPKSEIIQAAKDACIHDDIIRLNGGYDSQVTEGGVNFSGGQRQRLEIARALAINPSLLILDEATSALDPMTEQRVLDNIRHRGCSCLIIAHRLSTIRDADEIIVLERGKVVERGTHKEMIQHDGAYRRLIEERNAQENVD